MFHGATPPVPAVPAGPVGPTPLAAALARIGDRWSLLVVAELIGGPKRYNDLLAAVPGLASNILAQRLKALEGHGLVVARAYRERPRRLAYGLSVEGQELAGVLRLLAVWGAGTAPGVDGPAHRACGTPLETHWGCPTCGIDVADPATDDLSYA